VKAIDYCGMKLYMDYQILPSLMVSEVYLYNIKNNKYKHLFLKYVRFKAVISVDHYEESIYMLANLDDAANIR